MAGPTRERERVPGQGKRSASMFAAVDSRLSRWEAALSPRPARRLVLVCLVLGFLALRWFQRLQPWDSDDMTLFEISARAAEGDHWLLGSATHAPDAATELSHQALRVGLLPISVPTILALGAGSTAYYLVPLAFALVGYLCIASVALEHLGVLMAVALALIHIVWPFELAHGSIFLADLPSAALALLSLCLLDAGRCRAGERARLIFAVSAGLAALESYWLRSNVLVLLVPAYLVFLARRDARWLAIVAIAALVSGLLVEQALFVWRGLGWGYGWSRVHLALENYSEFLPIYSWSQFSIRPFLQPFTSFGRGVSGALAALVLLGSLLGHVLVLRFERRPLLLAIVVFGAFTWLVFSFSVYEWLDGGVRAMAPPSQRYIQPFTYSSLLVWGWLWCRLRERMQLEGRSAWSGAAVVALPLALFCFSLEASARHLPALNRTSESRGLLATLGERAASARAPIDVAGVERGLRVPRMLLCCDDVVRWLSLPVRELADAVPARRAPFVLRNIPRELSDARYLDPEQRRAYRSDLARVDDALWRDYALVHLDSTYALFERLPGSRDLGVTRRPLAPADAPVGTASLERACRVTPSEAGIQRVELDAEGRGSCEYTSPEDGILLPEAGSARSSDYAVRVSVDYQPPLSMTAEIVQLDAQGMQRRSQRLLSGTSYLPVQIRPQTRAVYVVYRLKGDARGDAGVTIEPARWLSLSPPAAG